MSNLVHAVKVESIPCDHITTMRFISGTRCRFSADVPFTEIPIEGLAGISQEKAIENNQTLYTVVATFSSCRRDFAALRRVAFRITSANGQQYLLGSSARPYPIIEETTPFPSKPADTTLKSFKVTWKGTLPLLQIEE